MVSYDDMCHIFASNCNQKLVTSAIISKEALSSTLTNASRQQNLMLPIALLERLEWS